MSEKCVFCGRIFQDELRHHCLECRNAICISCEQKQSHHHPSLVVESSSLEDMFQETARLNLPDAINFVAKSYATRPLFVWKERTSLKGTHYGTMLRQCTILSQNFRKFSGGKKVSVVLASKDPTSWWFMCQIAAVMAGVVSVGISPTFTDDQIKYVLKKLRGGLILCEESLFDRFQGLGLQSFLVIPSQGHQQISLERMRENVLLNETKDISLCHTPKSGEEIFGIIFTSGSTGMPKGVYMSEKRWKEEICVPVSQKQGSLIIVSFTQPAWYMSQWSVWRAIMVGGRVCFSTPENVLNDVKTFAPTTFFAPPVVWSVLQKQYERELQGLSKEDLKIKYRSLLGHRITSVSVGSAKVPVALRKFLEDVFGDMCQVYDGYGATEFGHLLKDGRVSQKKTQFRLEDCSELGYRSTDKPFPRGELCVKAPNMICEYVEDEAQSKEAWDEDGWYHTGDIVELISHDQMRFIDRKKNFFKTEDGMFVAATVLEELFTQCQEVQNCIVVSIPKVGCIVSLSARSKELLKEGILDSDDLEKSLKEKFSVLLSKNKFPSSMTPQVVVCDDSDWTQENGLLTSSLKPIRQAIRERFKRDLTKGIEVSEPVFEAYENAHIGGLIVVLLNHSKEVPQTISFSLLNWNIAKVQISISSRNTIVGESEGSPAGKIGSFDDFTGDPSLGGMTFPENLGDPKVIFVEGDKVFIYTDAVRTLKCPLEKSLWIALKMLFQVEDVSFSSIKCCRLLDKTFGESLLICRRGTDLIGFNQKNNLCFCISEIKLSKLSKDSNKIYRVEWKVSDGESDTESTFENSFTFREESVDHAINFMKNQGGRSSILVCFLEGKKPILETLKSCLLISQCAASTSTNLMFMTVGTQKHVQCVNPELGSVWGLARAVRAEYPRIFSKLVDIDPRCDHAEAIIKKEVSLISQTEVVVLSGGTRLTPSMRVVATSEKHFEAESSGVYIITGGAGSLGIQVCGWLLTCGAQKFVLMSRSGETQADVISDFEKLKGVCQVHVIKCDVSVLDEVEHAFQQIFKNISEKVSGVFHAAGLAGGALLQKQTSRYVERCMLPKSQGARNIIHSLHGRDPGVFVLFSSVSAQLHAAAAGALSYSASNAALDSFSFHLRQMGVNATSVQWGAWKDAGMAARNADMT